VRSCTSFARSCGKRQSRVDAQAVTIQADIRAPQGEFDVRLATGLRSAATVLAEYAAELRQLSRAYY
jgi:hypothetical protein